MKTKKEKTDALKAKIDAFGRELMIGDVLLLGNAWSTNIGVIYEFTEKLIKVKYIHKSYSEEDLEKKVYFVSNSFIHHKGGTYDGQKIVKIAPEWTAEFCPEMYETVLQTRNDILIKIQ